MYQIISAAVLDKLKKLIGFLLRWTDFINY